MEKRYQVFVSSTYKDLIPERLEVMRALLELNAIPCGMEYFPAANEDSWTFIKNLIDACDYYILVIGGCYGSEDSNGKSYTQKEYEYAVSKGIPTMGFIHRDFESLHKDKREHAKEKIEKLNTFIELVRNSKLCKDWGNKDELGAVVSRSLTQLMQNSPRVGWIRADRITSEESLQELTLLRKENEQLRSQQVKASQEGVINPDKLAFNTDTKVYGEYTPSYGDYSRKWEKVISWKKIFMLLSPYLIEWYADVFVRSAITRVLLAESGIKRTYQSSIDDLIFQQIKVQFMALGLVQVQSLTLQKGGVGLFWTLTAKGRKMMLDEGSVRVKSK